MSEEAKLAAVMVEWLQAADADVYQEVSVAGGVADIVAKVHAEIWIIETKTAPSLKLLYQAMDRRRHAHRVYIAVPRVGGDFLELCNELGVGVFTVQEGYKYGTGGTDPSVIERASSRRWNTRPVALASKLYPEHKTHAKAGAVGGNRWTPFRNTCEELARLVKANPGITLRSAIEQMTHHYTSKASARSSLMHWIQKGKIPGVRLDLEGTPAALYPVP